MLLCMNYPFATSYKPSHFMKPRQLLKKIESRRGFLELVYYISPADHYFRKSNGWHYSYLRQAYATIMNVVKFCKQKERFVSKLQLGRKEFDESQFLQDICEITIASHFAKLLPEIFEYEKKVSPPTDVDFAFCISLTKNDGKENTPHFRFNCNYHFEVKCPKITSEVDLEDVIKIHPASRFPSRKTKDLIIKELAQKLSGYKDAIEAPRQDNKLKDFLLSAQSKFNQSDDCDVNVLMVCCDNEIDMQDWRNYIVDFGGFFTETSIIPGEDFEKIDVILLSNVLNRHRIRQNKMTELINPWDFNKSFNLAYINPMKANKWQIFGLRTLFIDVTPEFEDFFKNAKPPENESSALKSILSVAWFSDANPDRGYFKKFYK